MGLTKYKLGDLIELRDVRNSDLQYGIADVRGVNNLKQLMPTKADLNGRDLTKFQIVDPSEFVFNHRTSRNGSKFSIAYNNGERPIICTEDYVVFRVKDDCKQILDAIWLYMFFNRPEFDRYVITNSWGSSTEFYNWEDICSISLVLPPIDIQRKYVAVYHAMLANQQSYERGLEDLKLTCDATVEHLKKEYPLKTFGEYIKRVDVCNSDKVYTNVKNVSVYKKFGEVSSKVDRNNLGNYKVVMPREISFVQTTHNEKVFCNAMNSTDEPILVTSVNEVFRCDESRILPEYLCLNFNRTEFDRYARFHSWGSARETFTWADLLDVKIPIPPVEEQKHIVDIFNVLQERTLISEKLKIQIKDLCPILIKGSIEEAQR